MTSRHSYRTFGNAHPEMDYANFQATFVKLGKLLEASRNWDEARARLTLQTDNPAYDPELMAFCINLGNSIEAAMTPLLEPFETLYGDAAK